MFNTAYFEDLREQLRRESIESDYHKNHCIICGKTFWDDDFKTVCDSCADEDYENEEFEEEEVL